MREALDRVLNDLPDAIGVRATAAGVYVGRLATMPSAEVCGGGELIAGVLVHFSGRFRQVGLFAMEPEAAFELVRAERDGADVLSSYTAVGCAVVRAVALAVDPLGVTQQGDATLRENSVIGTLLETHAPSDTAVVSVRLALSAAGTEASRTAHVYLLADPKPFAAAVAGA